MRINQKKTDYPDIASHGKSHIESTLDRVGMGQVEVPIIISDHEGKTMTVPGFAELYVGLDDPKAKGIHMSRLYLTAQEYLENHPLNWETLTGLLEAFVDSHEGLSSRSSVKISFDYPLKRRALISENEGWRFYPASLSGYWDEEDLILEMFVRITYSSTCPCSAALARQLIQENFKETFADKETITKEEIHEWLGKESAIIATPHGQRSHADIQVRFKDPSESFSLIDIINITETALKTPVQAAVKREDEQEFARLNGSNLMFCEDAARRIKAAFDLRANVSDYRIHTKHLESLHSHDAEAIVTKGIPGGLQP